MNRLHNLDYLRGLAAFSIMLYHFSGFATGNIYTAETILGRLGIYGVSIFYILSGLTLYLVYSYKMQPNVLQVADFANKRVFRIFPLLWLVIAANIVLNGMPNIKGLILNASGLFGFIRPTAYIGTGMWSIGNELVFYVCFPVLIFLINYNKNLFAFFTALILAIYFYFAFALLNGSQTLEKQWSTYINPLNQVFLFVSGVAMGYIFKKSKINNKTIFILLVASCCALVFYPASGDLITLVTGWNRIAFSIIVFLICLCFFKTNYELPNLLHKPLSILGEASYSVYLIHPLVWKTEAILLNKLGIFVQPNLQVTTAILITICVSYLVYLYFEKPFVRMGKQTSEKLKLVPVYNR